MARVIITIDDSEGDPNAVDIAARFEPEPDPEALTFAQYAAMRMLTKLEEDATPGHFGAYRDGETH
jgi:hypothetical protein